MVLVLLLLCVFVAVAMCSSFVHAHVLLHTHILLFVFACYFFCFRFVARRFTFDPNAQAANKRNAHELKTRLDRAKTDFERWCSIHFGEAFTAWIHIKAIRAFVESVLRYGLPVNYTALLIQPKKGRDEKIMSGMTKLYGYLDEEGQKDDEDGEFHPFYYDSFEPLSD